jgi:L-threonylcarbamoyladenylate synthase
MSDAAALEHCLADGGVALFPSDTVYGLACDPANEAAAQRLCRLKGRPLGKPSAVMFFDLQPALATLAELGPRTRDALGRVLPGQVTLILPNPGRRFPLACGDEPESLGIRVPAVERLRGTPRPVLQSSANLAGGPDVRRLADVPDEIRFAVDLVIDGGELPGTPSTVVDLRRYEEDGSWRLVRSGAVREEEVREALEGQWHFDPGSYLEMIRADVPVFDRLQDELAEASGTGAQRILELGTGTGETARRLLDRHPDASLVGVDSSAAMLAAARELLPSGRTELHVGRIQDPLPSGQFDLVASALCVHHLDGAEKAELFQRIHGALASGGRFALADLVIPADPTARRTPFTPGFDKPSSVAEQLRWLEQAGFRAHLAWASGDLAVLVGQG